MTLDNDPNFTILAGEDEYACYFNQLSKAFSHLTAAYRKETDGGNYEAAVVHAFLKKILATIEVLRLKYTYRKSHDRPLWVDLTESGFPNFAEIEGLSVDLENKDDRLQELPPTALLKRLLVDHLFQQQTHPAEILATLSERTYLEMLGANNLFLPFSVGELKHTADNSETRQYLFSFGCFDFQTNRPYVHLMTFEQDISEEPLEKMGRSYQQFLEAVQREGSRAADVGVLAFAIDDALEAIHPKIIKRVCLGPLYSCQLLQGRAVNGADPKELLLRALFNGANSCDIDFMLFVTDEIIFSKRQEVTRSVFSPQGKVREIFAIEESDFECCKRHASVVHHHVLLPHRLLQHISPEEELRIPEFHKARKIVVDEIGAVHGI